jgi:hypothetical protein
VTDDEICKDWSGRVAALVIDALMDHKIVAKADFDRATKIAAEEIFVRLVIRDRPDRESNAYKSR